MLNHQSRALHGEGSVEIQVLRIKGAIEDSFGQVGRMDRIIGLIGGHGKREGLGDVPFDRLLLLFPYSATYRQYFVEMAPWAERT